MSQESRLIEESLLEEEEPVLYEEPNIKENYIGSQSTQSSFKEASLKEASISSIALIKKQAADSINELAKQANNYMKESKKKDAVISRLQKTIAKLKEKVATKGVKQTRRKRSIYPEEEI